MSKNERMGTERNIPLASVIHYFFKLAGIKDTKLEKSAQHWNAFYSVLQDYTKIHTELEGADLKKNSRFFDKIVTMLSETGAERVKRGDNTEFFFGNAKVLVIDAQGSKNIVYSGYNYYGQPYIVSLINEENGRFQIASFLDKLSHINLGFTIDNQANQELLY